MKTSLLTLLAFLAVAFPCSLAAQQLQNAQAAEEAYYLNYFNTHPAALQSQEFLQQYALQHPNPTPQSVAVIPIVFHVVYFTNAQNIADSVIQEQLDILNEDYHKLNADTTTAVTYGFQSQIADCELQFCLATIDPNGNPTTGIERRHINSNISFNTNGNVQHYNTNGLDAWDPTQYLNVWICNLGSGLMGYSEFPTATVSQTYGSVIHYQAIGHTGAISPYNYGRTLTHELGHCFGLYHFHVDNTCTWNAYDSLVGIAPLNNQNAFNSCCNTLLDACSPSAPGIMWMNYMFYNDDVNLCMFTPGQKAIMWASLTNYYPGLLSSSVTACQPPLADDAGCISVLYPTGNLCDTSFAPIVRIKNYGSATMTSCTINYQVDSGPINTFTWTGSLATFATAIDTLPTISAAAGAHTLTVWTSSPNGNSDMNAVNDQSSGTFNTAAGGLTLPFTEGFENTTFPPPGWAMENPDNLMGWARTTAASLTGSASAWMNNFIYNANNQRDALITPPLDLTSMPTPGLAFAHAYQLYTNPSSTTPPPSDTLNVYVSTDCGATWSLVYQKADTALTTITPNYSNSAFVPTTSDWAIDSLYLTAYATCNHALLKIENVNGYENNLYIDEFSVAQMFISGINEQSAEMQLKLSPNPSNGQINLDLRMAQRSDLTLRVLDGLGRVQYSNTIPSAGSAVYHLDLSSLAGGVYFIEATTDGAKTVKKFVIQHN